MRRIAWFALSALIFFSGIKFYYFLTDDFRITNVTHEMPYNTEWEIEPLSSNERAKLRLILKQPYFYFDKGSQSYVLLSQDKQYIVKFFKFKHFRPNWLVSILPDSKPFWNYKTKYLAKKERLIHNVFKGYKLAYDLHRSDSALEYIQLNKSQELGGTITFFDKIGIKHILNLDDILFVVQKRVKTSGQVMKEALEQGDISFANKRIDQIIGLYLLEYSKGLYDRDHAIIRNTGFLDDKPIHLDVGKLSLDPKMVNLDHYKLDLIKMIDHYKTWALIHYPQYYPSLAQHVDERLHKILDTRLK